MLSAVEINDFEKHTQRIGNRTRVLATLLVTAESILIHTTGARWHTYETSICFLVIGLKSPLPRDESVVSRYQLISSPLYYLLAFWRRGLNQHSRAASTVVISSCPHVLFSTRVHTFWDDVSSILLGKIMNIGNTMEPATACSHCLLVSKLDHQDMAAFSSGGRTGVALLSHLSLE